ncbi:MAG TPA: hypothetical protein VLJ21_03320 [Candidatus Binatia bacterium]|nr:hypothetical protein [Candidatus Binatia bacterium]
MLRILAIQAYDRNSPESFLSVPLGIYRMGYWVEAKVPNVQFAFYDPNIDYPRGLEQAQKFLKEGMDGKGPYDVVAFSPLHFTLEHDLSIMYAASTASPNSLFVAGGQQAAFANRQLFSNWTELDVVFVGEGEKPMTELAKKVQAYGVSRLKENPLLMQDIPGVRLRGRPGITPPNPAMNHDEFVEATTRLDFGPRMRSEDYWNWIERNYTPEQLKDINLLRKIRVVKPYTTNYCPMDCSFCSTTNFYKDAGDGMAKVRGLRGKELSDYVRKILDTNQSALTVYFKDDLWFIRGAETHTPPPKAFTESIKKLIPGDCPLEYDKDSRGLVSDLAELDAVRTDPKYADRGITYFAKARVDTFVRKDLSVDWHLLAASKQAGFNSISFGVESFDRAELDHFNKRLGVNGPAMNRKALEACKSMDIHVVAYMILSSDISTPDSIMTSVDEAAVLSHEGHTIKINPFLYSLPGTTLAALQEKKESASTVERYPVPGYPQKIIERVIRIFPENTTARDLMIQFEERLPAYKQAMKEKLASSHWISELGTPTQFKLLLELAKEMKLQPKNTNTGQAIPLDERIAMLERDLEANKLAQGKMLTFA